METLLTTCDKQRVKFDSQTKQAFKSNEYIEFYKTLYLDRYLESNAGAVTDRRKRVLDLRSELAYATSVLEGNTKKGQWPAPPRDLLESTLNHLLTSQESSEISSDVVGDLMAAAETLKSQIESSQTQIRTLEDSIQGVYADMTHVGYHLHAVFMHEGEASYGHYWLYMWDRATDRWFKYNDSVVSQVPSSVVFQDTSGKNGNVYALAYVRDGVETSLAVRPNAQSSGPSTKN